MLLNIFILCVSEISSRRNSIASFYSIMTYTYSKNLSSIALYRSSGTHCGYRVVQVSKYTIAVLLVLFNFIALAKTSLAESLEVDPTLTEQWQPVLPIVVPGARVNNDAPSDAIVLFDGRDLDQWRGTKGQAAPWLIEDGVMVVKPGSKSIYTQKKFCDIQLHIEWRSPPKKESMTGQKLGNSGLFLPGGYEIQILDSYQNDTYVNGQAAAIYKQSPPLVNAMRPNGEWNSYDVIYMAPVFSEEGAVLSPAFISVLHNGVLVQNHFHVLGKTTHKGKAQYTAHGCAPIYLQDHGDKVNFRNIWVRELQTNVK